MRKPTRRVTHLLVGAGVVAATALTAPTMASAAPAGTTGEMQTYLVLFRGSSSPANAAALVAGAGGTVVADYAKIGVLVARSNNTAFDDRMRADARVEGASATADYATRVEGVAAPEDGSGSPGDLP